MKPKISLCMIVKNEEANLANCLNSVKSFVSEIIIVDTGSTDKTKEIALSFGANVFSFKWMDDFSAARNFSLSKASNDWILVLDADETFSGNLDNLDYDCDGYSVLQKTYTNNSSLSGFVHGKDENYLGWFGVSVVRLFRKGFIFSGRVHELVNTVDVKKSEIVLDHYSDSKSLFYLDLAKKKIVDSPSGYNYYELGVLYKENGLFDEAISSFEEAISLGETKAYFELGIVYFKLGMFSNAVNNFKMAFEDSEKFLNIGACYVKLGQFYEAEQNLKKCILLNPNKFKAYNNLGVVYEKTGRFDDAISILKKGLNVFPNAVGFYTLGVVYDKLGVVSMALKYYMEAVKMGHYAKDKIIGRMMALRKKNT